MKAFLPFILSAVAIHCLTDANSLGLTKAQAQAAPGPQPKVERRAERDIRDAYTFQPVGYDSTTLEAVSPTDGSVDLAQLNTPEKIEKRKLDLLAMTNPEEFFRRFPKSPEQLQAEAKSREMVLHPLTLEEKRKRQTPEENRADAAAIAAILTKTKSDGTSPKPTVGQPVKTTPAKP